MKKTLLFIAFIFLAFVSCDKEAASVADCLGENLLLSIDHEISADNTKKVDFTVKYYGTDHTLDNSVQWDFGDGATQTATGKTVSHLYTTNGNYTAKAKVSLNGGSCSYELKENVTVE